MEEMTEADRIALINAIATREGNARQLANRFGTTVEALRTFLEDNREVVEIARQALGGTEDDDEVTPTQLGELWISNKFDRLSKYQTVADRLYELAQTTVDPVVLRELRSYMMAAANELGQLLHRGSGEGNSGDTASYEFPGVDIDTMR